MQKLSVLHLHVSFQDLYFKKRPLNTSPHVKLKDVDLMTQEAYEHEMHRQISQARVLDHRISPCSDAFIPEEPTGEALVMYIRMYNDRDFETWMATAKVHYIALCISLLVLFAGCL